MILDIKYASQTKRYEVNMHYGSSSYNGIEIGDLVVLMSGQAEPYEVLAMQPGGMLDCQGQTARHKYQASALMVIKSRKETLLASANRRSTGADRHVADVVDMREQLERQRFLYIEALIDQESACRRRLDAARGELVALEEIRRVLQLKSMFSRNLGNVGEISVSDVEAKIDKVKKDVEKISEIINFIHTRVIRTRP